MEDREMSLEEAAKALAVMAERAGRIMKQEAQRAREESEKLMALLKEEARRARLEAEQARAEADSLREEFETIRAEMREQIEALQTASIERAADTQRSRRHVARAWGAVGVMGLAMLTGGAWTASSLSRSSTELAHASGKLQDARIISARKDGKINDLRNDVEAARTALARAEGELHAFNILKSGEKVFAASETPAPVIPPSPVRNDSGLADEQAFYEFEFGILPAPGAALVKDESEPARGTPTTRPAQSPATQPVVSLETETVGAASERSTFSRLMDKILGPAAKW